MDDNTKLWQGKPVAKESDKKLLDMDAATLEFKHLIPRQEAETQAYAKYVREQHLDASAHHLTGLETAKAAKDPEAAKKHWALYEAHSKALGHDPVGEPHLEVKARLDKVSGIYKFKVHGADLFAVDPKIQT